ncbi:Gfo/Idh/MocA family oxidoreductase [Mumia sp. zg.B21]|uniref:Gfo/Idh/MocA family protein n=1 Tax=unclassified Mumia TaxID=2621872 RepID=UPI001C6F0DFD|nr:MULTISPECIES: Gfo/Idh/MocA family oxidoreductase [unclassified Mumia]MBW9211440.1 Gfo/Idh/MocA family oxidoreductase [Mumia sp. zg.B21]MDD9347907.1 Gfo/Idh/MocA family oxidoreductase [Mumia sp.]
MTDELRLGIVGFGWMGEVHARAVSRLAHHFADLPRRVRVVAAADPAPDDRLGRAARAYGAEVLVDDWHDLVARDDVDVVSVTGPNHVHRDVAVAAARAGKHLWVEKPAGRTAVETREIAAAAREAGVQATVGFNYRNAPAVQRARELVASGRIGAVTHTTVRFLSDYAAHPAGALTWRFRQDLAGSGVLGDLVSHAVDLARHVVGEIGELVADDGRFIPRRPAAVGAASHFSRGGQGPLQEVENEDYVSALLRFADGSRGVLEAGRTSVGEQCSYGIEVHGERGALAWDFRRMGELRVCLDQDYQDASYATVFVGPEDGVVSAFQPGAGIAMGYDDLKVVEALRLVESIATGTPRGATIDDAVVAAEIVEAMRASIVERRWVAL